MSINTVVKNIFFALVCISVSASLWVFKDLLFPFVTSKAFFFRIAIELALPFYLYLIISDSRLRPNIKNPLSILAIVFLVINFVSSFTGNSVVRSLWGNFERMGGAYYTAHLVALYFYVLALGQMQGVYLQRFFKFFLFFALIVAGNGIFGWLGLPTFVVDPSLPTRVSSTLGNPIYLGSFLIIPFFLSLFLSIQAETSFSKVSYWFLSAIFVFGIFLSGTRGAVVGLILGSFISALVYIFLNKSNKIRTYGFLGVGIFILIVGALFIFSDNLPKGSIIQRLVKLKDGNSEARLIQWKIALTGYKEKPLLGTGPENYYVIANKYYNPEIYKYDRSWFDKPHNYILEILVTNGILGLLTYLSILGFMVISFYKAYKADFYGLAEFSILLASLLVYQIQNLFVFDTVPASLTFYVLVGFAGYLWHVSKTDLTPVKYADKINRSIDSFSFAVLGVSLVVVAYGVHASNVVPLRIAKNLNYGYAYANVDSARSSNYFDIAISLPFNFDKTETASKYADVASGWARGATEKTESMAVANLDRAISYMQIALEVQPDNPILWQRILTLYLYRGVQVDGKYAINPKAEEALNKAILLAPEREESYLNKAQILGVKGDLVGAQKVLEEAQIIFPVDFNLKIQLATILRAQGKIAESVVVYEKALEAGYNFASYNEIKWLIDYYVSQSKINNAILLCEKAVKIEPNNIQIFIDLARLYGAIGRKAEAIKIAQSIMNFDSTKKEEMQKLLDLLNQVATTTQVQK